MALVTPVHGRESDTNNDTSGVDYLGVESAPPNFPATRPSAVRLQRLNLEDWERLGRVERHFLKRVLVSLEMVKGFLADLLLNVAPHQRSKLRDNGPVLDFDASGRQQLQHYRTLGLLNRKLDIQTEYPIRNQALDRIRLLFDKTRPTQVATDRIATSATLLTIESIFVDVIADTGFHAIEMLFDRNTSLPQLAVLFEQFHREDGRDLARRTHLLNEYRASSSDTGKVVESMIDCAVPPCLEVIRSFQQKVDYIGVGLVPGEFVSRGLDRLFHLTNQSADQPD